MASTLEFIITYYRQAYTAHGLYIAVRTDICCTLILLFTKQPYRMHNREYVRRGLRVMRDPRFCFVEWEHLDQIQQGDTFFHSFYIEGWAPGDLRCWLFVATIKAVWSPSSSPIFSRILEAAGLTAPIEAQPFLEWQHSPLYTHQVKALIPALLPHQVNPIVTTFNLNPNWHGPVDSPVQASYTAVLT